MIAAIFIIVLGVLVVTVAVAGGLRRIVNDESDIERRLSAPGSERVSYAVPNGVDPSGIRVALARAGFTAVVGRSGSGQCLTVEWASGDRSRLRQAIENAHEHAYDGTGLDLHPLTFEDEKPSQT